jgi:hypothetical protein
MAFSYAGSVDARLSHFSQAGRDCTTNNVNYYNISFSLFGSRQTSPNYLPINTGDDLPRPISNSVAVSPRRAPHHSSAPIITVDFALHLIVQITNLLVDHGDSSNNHRDLLLQMKSLHQTLTMTRLAFQVYDGRPLGQSLTNTITPGVERCVAVLQELLGSVIDTCQGLNLTSIYYLWRPVWRSQWDGDELVALRTKLTACRQLFEEFLVALHSYVVLDSYARPSAKASCRSIKALPGWNSETNSSLVPYLSDVSMIYLANVCLSWVTSN